MASQRAYPRLNQIRRQLYTHRLCDLTGMPVGVMCTSSELKLSLDTPDNFVLAMKYHNLERGYMMKGKEDTKMSQFSHPLMKEAFEQIQEFVDPGHESIFFQIGRRTNSLLITALWNTTRGAGSGGVRYKTYTSLREQVFDTLRLSMGMGHKNALAGIWYGGGKATINKRPGQEKGAALDMATQEDADWRKNVFLDHGEFVTSLKGAYFTAEDVGTTPEDMRTIALATRFVNCIPASIGGSDNPSHMTARGVLCAMNAVMAFKDMGSVKGKRVAIQGLGNVGGFLCDELVSAGVGHIVASDVDPAKVQAYRAKYGFMGFEFRMESANNSVLFEDVDIISPCALGAILNAESIPRIRAPVIVGAANNQLLHPTEDDLRLQQCSKIYVPDFLCNCLGIVNCADEYFGVVGDRMQDPLITRYFEQTGPYSIHQKVLQVLATCQQSGQSSGRVAVEMANEAATHPHPIWPDRARQIQWALAEKGWANA